MNFVSFLLAYSTVFIWQQIYVLHILHQCGFAKGPALRASFHKKSGIRSIRSIADIAGYSFILLPRASVLSLFPITSMGRLSYGL